MTCGVYRLTAADGSFYIGSSVCIEARVRTHIISGGHSESLREAFALGAVEHSVIEECDKSILEEREQHHIATMRPTLNYNRRLASRNDPIIQRRSRGSKKLVSLYFPDDDHDTIKAAADGCGMAVTEWFRMTGLREAKASIDAPKRKQKKTG